MKVADKCERSRWDLLAAMQMKPGEASAGGRNRRVFGDMVEKKYGFFGIWTGGKKKIKFFIVCGRLVTALCV